jgi:peptidoglycan/LPS O-acetylase OafA/YrhL
VKSDKHHGHIGIQPESSSKTDLSGMRDFLQRRLWEPFRNSIQLAFDKQDYPLGYSAGLDGLRGLLTFGILTAHINLEIIPGSILFMDIFYVMSGYFITGLIQFYRRRFLRLVPPLAAMIAGFLLYGFFFLPGFRGLLVDAALGFFYVSNWWRAFEWPGVTYMGHTWSLATEEQFYLMWPLTFLLLFRCFGVGWRLVRYILMIALAVWMWRCWLAWNGTTHVRLYNGFDTRADALMLGCGLAVALTLVPSDSRPLLDRILKQLAWPVAICVLVFSFFFVHWEGRFYYYAGSILLGGGLGVLLVTILTRPLDTVLHRVLERRELVFLGRIFYAIYLWHYPIFLIIRNYGWPAWKIAIVGFPLTFLMAILSYAFIERHFMRVKAKPPGAPAASQHVSTREIGFADSPILHSKSIRAPSEG